MLVRREHLAKTMSAYLLEDGRRPAGWPLDRGPLAHRRIAELDGLAG